MDSKVNGAPINGLIAGFKGFRAINYEKQAGRLFAKLAHEGQSPKVLLIACSDSRVDPAILFSATPGELFVIRVVAALVPPYKPNADFHGVSAALEFAIRDLEVEHVVVLGHAYCGGIRALKTMEDGIVHDREFIGPWVSMADQAVGNIPLSEPPCKHEQAAVRYSVQNLLTFPWLKEKVETGKIELHAWWFDLDEGHLLTDVPGTEDFVRLV